MEDLVFTNIPVQYNRIKEDTEKLSFQMNSDLYTGSLLKTLVASKKSGRILELGTGGGLATAPPGHAEKAAAFIHMLESRKDLILTKLKWSTGIIIAVKK